MEIEEVLANNFSGPIVFNYIWWVLSEAEKRNIHRLYFLARDGYTLLRVARIFCDRFQLDIECRYLYCSRTALRMPTYFFIGDEAFELLLQRGYSITLQAVLSRGGLSERERREVYKDCGIDDVEEERQLSKKEFSGYVKCLEKSKIFHQYVVEKSRTAYGDAVGYFMQEGLFDQKLIAVVDSGWIGSMQRSLRQLLEFAGYTGELVGFYFGMYEHPKAPVDGEYLTWYFDGTKRVKDKAIFCNNLFECILSAPHGMTKGYRNSGEEYSPILTVSPGGQEKLTIEAQSNAICAYSAQRVQQIDFCAFDHSVLHRDTVQRIRRYMFTPQKEEVAYYSRFRFSDDVVEICRSPLAGEEQLAKLRDYFILRRAFRKMIGGPSAAANADLFWAYGTVSLAPGAKQLWYRWNTFIWEAAKYTAHWAKDRCRHGGKGLNYYSLVDKYDIVSFDIFDTLLYRTVNKPADVFGLMEAWAIEMYGLESFPDKRIAAEQRAREQSIEEEITFENIYAVFGMGDKEAAALMEYEKRTELSVLRRDEKMADLLQYCIVHGKKVLIISDMYHSEKFLSEALRQTGISGYSSLYVSSKEKCTKNSGNLYRHVMEKERITCIKSWLHIGDNYRSDYLVPRTLGIHAAIYSNGRSVCRSR